MSIQEIDQLSNAEKILLVERIWDSIKKDDLPLLDSHKQELERRIAKHQGGKNEYRSWDGCFGAVRREKLVVRKKDLLDGWL